MASAARHASPYRQPAPLDRPRVSPWVVVAVLFYAVAGVLAPDAHPVAAARVER